MAIKILALLYPKPDKTARVEEIAHELASFVKENESGALQYEWFRVTDAETPTIAVWETYTDEAAVSAHRTSSKMGWLFEIAEKEDNFAQPIKVMTLQQFAGFESR
ncbi:hypothetical protein V8F20_012365 [Naviculisporaceae sp. PSN 640]